MPEHEAPVGAFYDHETEEPRATGRRRRQVADWGVGEDVFDRMPSRRFAAPSRSPPATSPGTHATAPQRARGRRLGRDETARRPPRGAEDEPRAVRRAAADGPTSLAAARRRRPTTTPDRRCAADADRRAGGARRRGRPPSRGASAVPRRMARRGRPPRPSPSRAAVDRTPAAGIVLEATAPRRRSRAGRSSSAATPTSCPRPGRAARRAPRSSASAPARTGSRPTRWRSGLLLILIAVLTTGH